jgi:hypothetical protein
VASGAQVETLSLLIAGCILTLPLEKAIALPIVVPQVSKPAASRVS